MGGILMMLMLFCMMLIVYVEDNNVAPRLLSICGSPPISASPTEN